MGVSHWENASTQIQSTYLLIIFDEINEPALFSMFFELNLSLKFLSANFGLGN